MENLLSIAIQASIEAGKAIMSIYKNDFEVEHKSDNSPLTIADKNANDVINAHLIKTEIPIISEENEQLPFSVRNKWETYWLVDPLDGTKEFVKRNGEFTVNIALIKNNKPVLGVIYVPVLKTLYYGIAANNKAFKIVLKKHLYNEINLCDEKHEIKPQKNKQEILKIVGSRSHNNEETKTFIQKKEQEGNKVEMVAIGSSLKFCLVAEGKADIYPRFAPTMEWDTAAGHAICNSVGLKVSRINLDQELLYNKKDLLNPYFIVS